jgi:hypothetical protein
MTDDLVKRLRVNHSSTWKKHEPDIVFEMYESDRYTAADRIEQLEAALREIANPDSWEGMDWVSHGVPKWIARAALENKDD